MVSQDIGSRAVLERMTSGARRPATTGIALSQHCSPPSIQISCAGSYAMKQSSRCSLPASGDAAHRPSLSADYNSSRVWKDVAVFHAEAARPRTDSRTVQDDTHLSSRHRFPPLHLRPSPTSPATLQHDRTALSPLRTRERTLSDRLPSRAIRVGSG